MELHLENNDNLFVHPRVLSELLTSALGHVEISTYPDLSYKDLRVRIGKYYNVEPNDVTVGCGSAQLIDFLLRRYAHVIYGWPNFGLYRLVTDHSRIRRIEIPLSFEDPWNLQSMMAVGSSDSLAVIVSPHCPLGCQLEESLLLDFLNRFPGTVLLDEAYVEYGQYSAINLVPKFSNLVVLRTFSKAWGLAALRVGFAVGAGLDQTEIYRGQLVPWSIGTLSAQACMDAMDRDGYVKAAVQETRDSKQWTYEALRRIRGLEIYNTAANFLLLQYAESKELLAALEARRLYLRDLDGKVNHGLRMTIGPLEKMRIAVARIREAVDEVSARLPTREVI